MVTEFDWSWFAGYIEAKRGGLSSYLRNDRTYFTIDLTSSDLGLLEWISNTFDLPKPFYLTRQNTNRIAIRSKSDLTKVLTNILPYLKSVQRQSCREVVDTLTK